jgi:hypothetical protein
LLIDTQIAREKRRKLELRKKIMDEVRSEKPETGEKGKKCRFRGRKAGRRIFARIACLGHAIKKFT